MLDESLVYLGALLAARGVTLERFIADAIISELKAPSSPTAPRKAAEATPVAYSTSKLRMDCVEPFPGLERYFPEMVFSDGRVIDLARLTEDYTQFDNGYFYVTPAAHANLETLYELNKSYLPQDFLTRVRRVPDEYNAAKRISEWRASGSGRVCCPWKATDKVFLLEDSFYQALQSAPTDSLDYSLRRTVLGVLPDDYEKRVRPYSMKGTSGRVPALTKAHLLNPDVEAQEEPHIQDGAIASDYLRKLIKPN